MTSQMENPALAARGVPAINLAAGKIEPEYALELRRRQYLAEIFALPPHTAVVVAELAFGEARA
ncbi:hypothetical protein I6F09_04950 [Bradyrhizobium sp. IC3195]|uniref:hypothetical protein n=1 Tax=Bradyrhizobium sp. IC3195 TaxID=2793804 RepID=UPI001CD5D019|nr:hypothetical protein [Bradyrhizobium sp. IC3195]MCA1467235.1 hypothetical protein [Bradyrhizobium sp. IC3195]